MDSNRLSIKTLAESAKTLSYRLANLDTDTKNRLLKRISEIVADRRHEIATANQRDVEEARKMVSAGQMRQPLLSRLMLSDDKIDQLRTYLDEVAKLEDPTGRVQYAVQLDEHLELRRVSCPIGVVAVIFETRPEVVIQVTALSLKSGNAVILKGGKEAAQTNRALFDVIQQGLTEFDLEGSVHLIETREDVAGLLQLDESIDLIIPRGGNEFVRYIQENTRIPVIGHSEGICHVYIDPDCDPEKAIAITLDAKLDYPAACNAVETLLVDEKAVPKVMPELLKKLRAADVELIGCEKTRAVAAENQLEVALATEAEWRTEYTDLKLTIRVVPDLDAAIAHINQYGSHHTDTIVTENPSAAQRFLDYVDSGCVFHNASTRFSDGYVFGLGAEVGISTHKTHSRGPVGLEGMVIYKYLLKGNGQLRATYSGADGKPFLHQPLSPSTKSFSPS